MYYPADNHHGKTLTSSQTLTSSDAGHPGRARLLESIDRGAISECWLINESAHGLEAAIDHLPGAPCDSNIPRLQHLERGDRGIDRVSQIM